jgi:ATP-dependent exoDNAse (exonuclease V) alpha subunit
MKRDDLVLISQGEYVDSFTTQKIIDIEEELVELARTISKRSSFNATLVEFNSATAQFKTETGFKPTDEQVLALEHACLKGDFAIIQGSAGAGKSTMTRIIKILFQKRGLNILGTTVVKKAANNLMSETGIESLTVAKIQNLIKENSAKVRNLDALVIDEAGQVSSFVLLEILRYAEKYNIKIILSGEDKQLDAISHGGSLAFLMNELGGYRIEKIQRQRAESDRLIVGQFRDGMADKAFEKLNENGLLNFSKNLDKAQTKLMDTLINYIDQTSSKDYIVLASKWSKVDSISRLIRDYLKSIEKISEIEFTRECVVSNHNCVLAFAVGDSVRFSRNDYRLGVVNGLSGQIVDLIEDNGVLKFKIALDSGKTISFTENQYKDEDGRLFLSHAYASTIYSSQGLTVDGDAFILWDSSMHRSLTYVAGSRHRDRSHWFFNNAELNEFRKDAEEPYIVIASNIASKERQKKLAIQSIKDQQGASSKAYSH